MATNNEAILEEVEALQAIMMDEVSVIYGENGVPSGIEATMVPATAQNIEEQHVRVTLVLSLPSEYPDVSPSITLRNPRGVDDHVLTKIQEESKQKCEEYLGCPVIYELIEVVRENLTANNTPSCPCAICLHHFTDDDDFTKTPCFHYFHSYCLGRYVVNCAEEAAAEEEEPQPAWMAREKKHIMCPVCRDPIQEELNGQELLQSAPPEEGKTVAEFNADDPDLIALQQHMASLYLKQKEKGGIIDLEEERNKFLLSANRVDSCDALEVGGEEVLGSGNVDTPVVALPSDVPVAPPAAKRGGGRPAPHRPQGQKPHGGHSRQSSRNMDQGRDRYWGGGRGGGRGNGGRGRGGNSRSGYHNTTRFISETHNYNSQEFKAARVIDNGYGTKGHGKREVNTYENGSLYASENEVSCGAGGSGRKGPKNFANRQRYGQGRGRGRGPPPGFTPSGYRHTAQDWS